MKKILFTTVLAIVVVLVLMHLKVVQTSNSYSLKKQISITKSTNKTGRTHLVYFTGANCPHCARVAHVLAKEKLPNKNLLLIEYEIQQQPYNASLMLAFNDRYNIKIGIPLIIAGNEVFAVGYSNILNELDKMIDENKDNNVVLSNQVIAFEEINISQIRGLPKIWYNDRVAIKKDINSLENDTIKNFILNGIIPKNVNQINDKIAYLSSYAIAFQNTIEYNGWILMYNSM